MRMKKVRAAAAALLCAACLAQTAVPALAAEAYTAPDVTGKTLEQLMDDFRAEHALTGDNFEISFYVPETGEQYDFNETKMLYGASTYKLPLNLYYYDMQLAGEISGDTGHALRPCRALRPSQGRHVGRRALRGSPVHTLRALRGPACAAANSAWSVS